jgi:hypothetical protein
MVFHVQLQWRSWLQDQITSDTRQKLEQQNNLAWVPSCANVPQLQALLYVQRPTPTPRAPCATGGGGGGADDSGGSGRGGNSSGGGSVSGGTTAPGGAATGNETPAGAYPSSDPKPGATQGVHRQLGHGHKHVYQTRDRGLIIGWRPSFSNMQWGAKAYVCIVALQGCMPRRLRP